MLAQLVRHTCSHVKFISRYDTTHLFIIFLVPGNECICVSKVCVLIDGNSLQIKLRAWLKIPLKSIPKLEQAIWGAVPFRF